jgi:CBS domain containing-hemolysin-like protein
MERELPMDEAETLGGFIYSVMGRVPASGDGLNVAGIMLTVEQVSGRRIRKVRAKKVQVEQGAVKEQETEHEDETKN